MVESDLNRIIKKNILNQGQWAEKISDPAGIAAKMASKNPFDGFFYTKEFNGAFESKLIKNKYESFQFSRIEDHQIGNLKKIKDICKEQKTKMLTVISLGVFIPRKGIDLFLFDIDFIIKLIKEEKKSFLKKELLLFKDKDRYIKINNSKEFDYMLLEKKCIYGYDY